MHIQIVTKTATMRRNEWVENADRLVAGFLERFEEGFHKMVGSQFLYMTFVCMHKLIQIYLGEIYFIFSFSCKTCRGLLLGNSHKGPNSRANKEAAVWRPFI